MRRYPQKRRIRPWRYVKHYLYRVQHYTARALSLPFRIWEYYTGMLHFRHYPMQRGMCYKSFSKENGRYGEYHVWRKARAVLGKDCRFLFNLYLPKKDGSTCEVDLVALSHRGIFVFESKNYSGRIYGEEDKPYWYQMVRRDIRTIPKKSGFFNPIMQNAMHARAIGRLCYDYKDKIHPIVVFGNRCRLTGVKWDKQKSNVIKCKWLGWHLFGYKKNALDTKEIEQLYTALSRYGNADYITKTKHLADIQEKHNR